MRFRVKQQSEHSQPFAAPRPSNSTRIVEAAQEYPINYLTVIDFLKVDLDQSESEVQTLIEAATTRFERYTNRSLINRKIAIDFQGFHVPLQLPYAPVSAVESIVYRDSNDVEATIDPSMYQLTETNTYGMVRLKSNFSYPSTQLAQYNPITLTYTAGYGANESAIPADLKHCLLMMVANSFEYRELSDIQTPFEAMEIMQTYRVDI